MPRLAPPHALPALCAALALGLAAAAPARAAGEGFRAMADPAYRLGHPATGKALDMLGIRYKWGGTSARDGMDCSGFVWRSYRDALGLTLPRTAAEMARKLAPVMPHELLAGDLVFFNTRGSAHSHVGIYLGGSMFAHSPRPGASARIDSIEDRYWLAAFDGAVRPGAGVEPSLARAAFDRALSGPPEPYAAGAGRGRINPEPARPAPARAHARAR